MAVRLLCFIFVLIACSASVGASLASRQQLPPVSIGINWHSNDGALFTLTVDNKPWLTSRAPRVYANGRMHSSRDQTNPLKFEGKNSFRGSEGSLGSFEAISFAWQARDSVGNTTFNTTFKLLTSRTFIYSLFN